MVSRAGPSGSWTGTCALVGGAEFWVLWLWGLRALELVLAPLVGRLVPPAGKEGQVLGSLVGEAGSGLRGPTTVVLLVDGAVFSLSYLPGLVLTGWRVGAGPSPNKQGRRFKNGRCQHQCPQGKY